MKMTMGANERGKVLALLALLVIAAAVFWINSAGEEAPVATSNPGPRPVAPQVAPRRTETAPRAQAAVPAPSVSARARVLQEFRPSLKPRRPEDRPDPMSLDPQLRTDVLAKLLNVGVQSTSRNIFDFSQAPPPKTLPSVASAKPPVPSPIVGGQNSAEGSPSIPPPPPPPPKVPLKFYGFIAAQGPAKRAFFLEGEEIHVVSEGDVVKKRYRILRIGVNSVVVEDMGHENNQQTLPLEEAPAG